jgi:hypothetical protein
VSRSASRDALVMALVGRPRGLPGPERIDLAAFWKRFDTTAPLHVRAGFTVATVALAVVAPRWSGHRHGLATLDRAAADEVVRRAATQRRFRPLLDAATVVACFAYFSDARVEAAVRGELQVDPAAAEGNR